ncbi:MAG: DNA methylase [Ignavibacteria bacterium RIFOXYB2_FULL_35_12]|nr:MAG: DNA methylase [Ignavibacteria bacterium GWA2_36_19]OGU58621.1 MAG: DNA methylase [Ignavibacteria bacterium GWF2_35_20]OGU80418.1 MAG: DNA methylase [Ignavibacteria bacterium RIFOXYA2_FULL_35_9]OGU87098.1 MAG: DNA methylase [Ignavibacteria bacterium RIFOXYA12_FULL_35_25]OGU92413.1 MAG: DNA methylase [Ignavibacteria bacterium RIFOXYC12_FULL_35_11]OGU95790.1 MAG: DNA methylase [Ignavibacteria bacterium RIFOXYB12_FULL_35_14]OGU99603.1 MAG: DNA methylase [Ignavibacteria bacterium RIFOXYC2_
MRRKIIPYNPKLKEKARELRNNSTFTEVMVWNYLKNKQIKGYDFHRQKPLYNYIVDFFYNELMLAIEIDGESHYGNEKHDIRRQKRLENLGISFLRFDDMEVRHQLDKVIKRIEDWIDDFEKKSSR